MPINVDKLKNTITPMGMPFRIAKLGHLILQVSEWHGVKSLEEAIAKPVPGQDTHLNR